MRELGLTLPDAVRSRVAEQFGDTATTEPRPDFSAKRGRELVEVRRSSHLELRADEDGNPQLSGYATVYGEFYEVFGGPPWGWAEVFDEGACDKTVRERDDVRLLVNHEGVPLGRTVPRTLELVSDSTGVGCTSTLDIVNPTVVELKSAMDRGDIDQMSLAFRAIRQEWNDDFTERHIIEAKLFDVSVVTYPANEATFVELDSAEDVGEGMSLGTARAMAELLDV